MLNIVGVAEERPFSIDITGVTHYSRQTATNGAPVTFAVPHHSRVWLEALTNGTTEVTLSFIGTDDAEGFNRSSTLLVTAAVPAPSLLLQVTPYLPMDSTENVFDTYLPGYYLPWLPMITLGGGVFSPQKMRLAADLPLGFGVTQVRFTLSDVTSYTGFCMNASAPSGTGLEDGDFSFHQTQNSTNVTAAFFNGRAVTDFWCKDYGGYCKVTAEFLDKDGNVVAAAEDEAPRRTPDAPPDDFIAEHWRQSEAGYWQAVYPLITAPPFAMDWDEEPAALGNARTDGSYSHGSTGDGLTVWQEYRGYTVDGGAGFIGKRHVRLSPVDKELLVQVNTQGEYYTDVGTGGAVMQSPIWIFGTDYAMSDVAYFFSDPLKGAGINLYWVKRDFVPLQGPAIMNRTNAYRYEGDMVYTPKQGVQPPITGDLNGKTWISADAEYSAFLGRPNRAQYYSVFPPANGIFRFMMGQNRDMQLPGFVLLLFPSRHAWVARENNAPYKVYPQTKNAFTILDDPDVPNDPHRLGSVVNVVGVAEERPFSLDITGVTHYSGGEFLDVIRYCVAHELFHLLGSKDNQGPLTNLYSPPFNDIIISKNELLQINLKQKKGVTP